MTPYNYRSVFSLRNQANLLKFKTNYNSGGNNYGSSELRS